MPGFLVTLLGLGLAGCDSGPVRRIDEAGDLPDAGPGDASPGIDGGNPPGPDATAGPDAQADAGVSDAGPVTDAQTPDAGPDAAFEDAADAGNPDVFIPPPNNPPVIRRLVDPENGAKGIRTNAEGRYLFKAEVTDPENDPVSCEVEITKEGVAPSRAEVEVNPDFALSPPLPIPELSFLCWELTSCTDSHNAETAAGSEEACFYATADGVVQWWPMDALDNGIFEDKSGVGLDGRAVGTDLQPGVAGNALHCDGVDDFLQTEPGNLGISNTWTISFSVYADVLKPEGQTLFTLGRKEPDPMLNTKNYLQMIVQGDQKINIQYLGDDRSYASFTTVNPVLTETGVWYQVTLTKGPENTLESLALYVNGDIQPLAGHQSYSVQADDGDRRITLCKEAEIEAGFFAGRIDEFVLYDFALPADQIAGE